MSSHTMFRIALSHLSSVLSSQMSAIIVLPGSTINYFSVSNISLRTGHKIHFCDEPGSVTNYNMDKNNGTPDPPAKPSRDV